MRFTRVLLFVLVLFAAASVTAQEMFRATLAGRHEVAPVPSQGSGEVEAVLDGNQLTVSGIFREMNGAFDATIGGGAHIHLGLAGENGSVALALTTVPDVDLRGGVFLESDNTFMLTEDQVTALRNRGMYVNIHTTDFPGGELRGQLLPQADAYYYTNLLGSNEVPVAMTQAGGALTMELHGDTLIVVGAFDGLESDFDTEIAGGAHLHTGMAGENGGVDILLNATTDADLRGGEFTAMNNTFVLTEAQKMRLRNRGYYANLHSTEFPGGELRGQTTAMADLVFRAHLSGMNENPVVVSEGNGQILGELKGDTLVVSGRFDDLESMVDTSIVGGLHLHAGKAGTNGPVAIVLNADFDADMRGGTLLPENNTFALTSDQRALLTSRSVYLNVHSLAHGAGEIRGQMLPEAQIVLHGNLSGVLTVPGVTTTAYGALKAELNGDQLYVSGSYHNLGSLVDLDIAGGAHLHLGAAGETGGIEFGLTSDFDLDRSAGEFSAMNNRFTLDSAQVANMRARKYYANIHTLDAPSGELRAQLVKEANYYFTAPLSGASEVPVPINTTAQGMVMMEVTGDAAVAHGAFSGLSSVVDTDIVGGAHLHAGMAGQAGPVIKVLNSTLTDDMLGGTFEAADNAIPFSDGELDTLRNRGYYVNIHTTNFGAGELRGQALPMATAYFTTTLAGINEVQPIMTDASGGLKLELNGDVLTTSGAFAGLQSAFNTDIAGGAHLHLAGPGANGGVDILLNTALNADSTAGTYQPDSNRFTLDMTQISALPRGDYYANLHSRDIPSGELRGQILSEINLFPTNPPAILEPADAITLPLVGDLSTLVDISWELTAEDDNELAYIWQVATDASFDTVVFQTNTGANAGLQLTYGALDTLLAGLGVEAGATATIYHRAVATDGANQTAGPASVASFTRDMSTSTQDLLAEGTRFEAYPTVTQGTVQLRAELKEAGEMSITLLNGVGQPVRQIRTLGNRQRLQESIQLGNQPAGMYFIQLRVDGRPVATQRVLKR